MIWRFLYAGSLALCATLLPLSAEAITINGIDYEKALSFSMDVDNANGRTIGYWRHMKTFYTYKDQTSLNLNYSTIGDDAAELFDSFKISGTTTTTGIKSDLATASLTFFDEQKNSTLAANFVSNGSIEVDFTQKDYNVSGLFSISQTAVDNLGILGSTLYVEFIFDKITSNGTKDIYGTLGTLNIYTSNVESPRPPTEVPEPASLTLLMGSLLGISKLKRQKLRQ